MFKGAVKNTGIQTFEPGPSEPPPPIPDELPVPRMAAEYNLAPRRPAVWKVTEVELQPLYYWLAPRLREKYPRLQEDGLLHWLRCAMSDRRTTLVRTENVVGMFYIHTDVLEPQPIVIERFVRSNDAATKEEQQQLYTYVRDWAQSIKARELRFGFDTDCNMQQTTQGQGISVILQDERKNSTVRKKTTYTASFME